MTPGAPGAALQRASRGTDGAPRLHAALAALGCGCGRTRVAWLRRRAGLGGGHRRRAFKPPRRAPAAKAAPAVVPRAVAAVAPDRLGVADLTDGPTGEGFLSVAVVRATFSRRVVGWSRAAPLRAEVGRAAREMASTQRQPATGLIHPSDHGSQSTSRAVSEHCRAADIRRALGAVGACCANARAESFFATLEGELLTCSLFRTHTQARSAVVASSACFANRQRRHSARD